MSMNLRRTADPDQTFSGGQLVAPFAPPVRMPTIQPTNSPYADATAAAVNAPSRLALAAMNAVANAASAAANTSAAQPMKKPAAPPAIFLATITSTSATNTSSRIARRSLASRSRMAELLSSVGPTAQRGQVSCRRNQPQTVPAFVCRSTHSVNAWLPKASTSTAVPMTPAPATVREPPSAMESGYGQIGGDQQANG